MTIRLWRFPSMLFLASCLSLPVHAEDKSETFESHFNTGISPDGRTEITILSKPGQYKEDLYLRFTNVKSGRLLGDHSFDGFSFALHDKPSGFLARDDIKCAWRSDSGSVAVSCVMTRGFVGTTIYSRSGKHWVPAAIPEFGKQLDKFCREAGEKRVVIWEEAPSKGHETFVKWLSHRRFRLEAGYWRLAVPDADAERIFWITFRLVDSVGKSKPKIVLEKIEFAPDPYHPVQK